MDSERSHGSRARYVFGPNGSDTTNGCRCAACSAAAVRYEKRRVAARNRGEVAYIDATEARAHLQFLAQRGVGRRQVAALTGLSSSQVRKIRDGTTTRVRERTADRILAVHAGQLADGARVDAAPTLARIDDLVTHAGMTRAEIAAELGYRGRGLQIGKEGTVTRRNAHRVEMLWRTRMAPVLAGRDLAARRRAAARAAARGGDGRYTQRHQNADDPAGGGVVGRHMR